MPTQSGTPPSMPPPHSAAQPASQTPAPRGPARPQTRNPAHSQPNSPDSLRGVVERITFHNDENGYTIAKLTPEGRAHFGSEPGEVTIVGNMAGIHVGEFVEIQGAWTVHATYGRQFTVEQMRTVLPATVAGIEKYLGSGLIRGVGPVTAKRIVRTFGAETLEVIENTPARLSEVPGVGQKRIQMILTAWAEQRAIKEVMIFLQSHGVSTSLATRIYKTYGDAAVGIVSSDPYRLAQDIFGIGFLTADRIAQSLGLAHDSPQRVAAGVAFALQQASENGHVFLPLPELVEQAGELLGVAPAQIGTGLIRLWDSDQIKIAAAPGRAELSPTLSPTISPLRLPPHDETPSLVAEHGSLFAAGTLDRAQSLLDPAHWATSLSTGISTGIPNDTAHDAHPDHATPIPPAVYLTPLYYSELGTAGRVHHILHDGVSGLADFRQRDVDWTARFQAAEQADGLRLAPQQQDAVRAALTHRLVILTGGPGTGKTTTVRALLHLCDTAGCLPLLAAPTGRAAKRLAETTGRPAKTLHRLLEFKPAEGMTFQRNEDSPLTGDLLIVDEASMLDLALAHHLLKAVPPGMHVLLVGDVDQLPSVGAGNVLQDMIRAVETGSAPASTPHPTFLSALGREAQVIRLQTIFRQAAGSYIITNAHRINQGQVPILANQEAQDFFLFRVE
ncbi:MAG: AAA family ATPase, partial [Litorilinea sp.]